MNVNQVLDGTAKLAQLWFPGTDDLPGFEELSTRAQLLDRARRANPALAESLSSIALRAAEADPLTYEVIDTWPSHLVEDALTMIESAYFMSSDVRQALGYPGQSRVPVALAGPDEVLTKELVAPVIERGPTYVQTPAKQHASEKVLD